MKIATKISLGIMISVMTIAIIMAVLMNIVSEEIIQENYSDMMQNSVLGKGVKVEETLGRMEESLNIVAEVVESELSYDKAKSEKFLESFFPSIEILMKSTANTNRALAISFYINPDFHTETKGIRYTDLNSIGIYQNEELIDLKRADITKNDMLWYSQGLVQGEYWTVPYFWRPWRRNIITYSKAIKDKEGRFLGILAIDMTYEKITYSLKDIQFYNGGFFALLDSEYNIVFHPDSNLIGQNMREVPKMGKVIKEFGSNKRIGFLKYETDNNIKRGMAFNKLNNDWIVFVTIDDKEFLQDVSVLRRNFFFIVVLITLIATLISKFLANAFSRPILEAVEKIKTGAVGDLSVRIDSMTNDEINVLINSFNFFMDKLDHLFAAIKNEALSVEASAEEMNLANEELAKKASEQASALEENTSTMKQINKLVNTNTDRTMKADIMAKSVVDNTHNIEDASAKLKNAMSDITESSRQIEDIIEIIDEIAFQTNILSLNAAVEAARAGEQGRGFAVVASEIRTLSKKSSASAKKIKQRIKHSVEKVEEGDKLVIETIKYLSTIIDEIEDISKLIYSIRESAQEQKQAVEQVYGIIGDLESATQSNASIAEETSSSMAMFYEKIKTFLIQVDKFKVSSEKGREGNEEE